MCKCINCIVYEPTPLQYDGIYHISNHICFERDLDRRPLGCRKAEGSKTSDPHEKTLAMEGLCTNVFIFKITVILEINLHVLFLFK